MNIRTPHGCYIRFLDRNGTEENLAYARKYLKAGSIYRVAETIVHDWHTDVYLIEIPDTNVYFNSSHFENVTIMTEYETDRIEKRIQKAVDKPELNDDEANEASRLGKDLYKAGFKAGLKFNLDIIEEEIYS